MTRPTGHSGRARTDEYSNLPFLNPSNDSRVNLLLLLLDEGHAKFKPSSDEQAAAIWSSATPIPFSTYTDLIDMQPAAGLADTGLAQGEGSRCVSNEAGAADFQAALAEAKDLPGSGACCLVQRAQGLVAHLQRGQQHDACPPGCSPWRSAANSPPT